MAYLNTSLSESLAIEHLDVLNRENIWTVNDLVSVDLMDLKRRTDIKYKILKDIHDQVKQRYTLPLNELNFVIEKSIQECKICPTGLPELTFALDGGFQTQEIVEFFGDSECGKTEMCYLLCGEILSHYEDFHILYIAANHDIDHEKVAKYTKFKAGNRELDDEDIYNCLSKIEVARPTKLADLVHLLNTLVHSSKRHNVKCLIIDSLSFIIQEDILEIKSASLQNEEELEKFGALKGITLNHDTSHSAESIRRDVIDIYLHEVMRLIVNIAITQNVIVVLTNSDQQLAYSKSWTNAIDHRIHLSRMSEYSRYCLHNPRSTVCEATILKTIHNISKVGYSIPFAINDEGIFAIRLGSKSAHKDTESESQVEEFNDNRESELEITRGAASPDIETQIQEAQAQEC